MANRFWRALHDLFFTPWDIDGSASTVESLDDIPETTEEWFKQAKLKVPEEKNGRQ